MSHSKSARKSLVQNFLWEGKPSKIAYDTLTLPIEAGGLNLIDFEMKVRSLKLAWVTRLTDNSSGKWKAAPSTFLETDDLQFFFKCNRTLSNSPTTNTELVQGVSVNIQDKIRLLSSCSTKIFYHALLKTTTLTPKCIARWKSDFPETETKDWGKIFNTTCRTTRETKLQTVQYKILHRIITRNKKLFEMKIQDSPECSYCEAVDNIAHFFV